jgi:N utilization substance protein B
MLEQAADELLEQLRRVFPPGPFLDRRLGRAFAFQALYEMDQGHHPPAQVLERQACTFDETPAEPESAYSSDVLSSATSFAQDLVKGVMANRAAIDKVIQQRAPLWPLAQMSAVDRNVLRIGLYESLYGNATVPLRTAINEAVELAKLFGSETSAKFVNGVLGRAVEANVSGESPPTTTPTPEPPHAPG